MGPGPGRGEYCKMVFSVQAPVAGWLKSTHYRDVRHKLPSTGFRGQLNDKIFRLAIREQSGCSPGAVEKDEN